MKFIIDRGYSRNYLEPMNSKGRNRLTHLKKGKHLSAQLTATLPFHLANLHIVKGERLGEWLDRGLCRGGHSKVSILLA